MNDLERTIKLLEMINEINSNRNGGLGFLQINKTIRADIDNWCNVKIKLEVGLPLDTCPEFPTGIVACN